MDFLKIYIDICEKKRYNNKAVEKTVLKTPKQVNI